MPAAMRAPVVHTPGHSPHGAGAYAWAGVVGPRLAELQAVGTRSDGESRRLGESVLVELSPGKVTPRLRLPIVVRAVGGTAPAPLLLDEEDRLWRVTSDAQQVAEGIVDVCGSLALGRDGRVVVVDGGDGEPRLVAERVTAVGDGLIATVDGLWPIEAHVRQPLLDWTPPAPVTAVARRGHEVAVVVGRTCFVLQLGGASLRMRAAQLPVAVTCLARAPGRWLLGSPTSGLYAIDDDDDDVCLIRPSLRAHQLHGVDDGVVAVARLYVGSSDDGREWLARDLSAIARVLQS
jgi:hypothetical protein